MVTINDVKKVIEDFKIDMNEINNHLDKQDNYIKDMAFKAEQLSTALELLKFMTVNRLAKINSRSFNINNKFGIVKPYDPASDKDPMQKLHQHDRYNFIVLDKESPWFMAKLSVVGKCFSRDPDMVQFDFEHNGENITSILAKRNDNETLPCYDEAISDFIYIEFKKKSDINDIRKATSVENHPIGKQD